MESNEEKIAKALERIANSLEAIQECMVDHEGNDVADLLSAITDRIGTVEVSGQIDTFEQT